MIFKAFILFLLLAGLSISAFSQKKPADLFPDGTPIPKWFSETSALKLLDLGKQYVITDFGAVNDSNLVQTQVIQKAIDDAARSGGGAVIIPKGVYLSGALFFKPKTHLYISDGATLKGSDNIADYPLLPSRIEGQNLPYFAALINADGLNGFTISGKGTINGNGLKFWEAFWARRKENPNCTNLEVSRPRLIFVQNSSNIQFQDVRMINSGFWTNHFYKCHHVKLINLYVYSPFEPVKAPSTDAIDIDACSDVLVKGCYLSVNDDAIALKGGKGPLADKDTCNGMNSNIIIENCEFGFCHSALTCGSEAIHNRNILMRRCKVKDANRLLWLKMRPDTPQKYEYIRLENIRGSANSFIYIKPWTQFFDLKGQKDMLKSSCENISLQNIQLKCDVAFDMEITQYQSLSGFKFSDLNIEAKNGELNKAIFKNLSLKKVIVNKQLVR
jgi:polygalacturonase